MGNLTAGSPSVRDRNIWLQTVLCKTPLLSLLHGFLSTELLPKDGHVSQRTLGHPLVSHVCAVGSSSLEAESRLLVCTISGQLMSPLLEPGQGSAAVPSGAWPGESHVCVEGPCSNVHPSGQHLPVVQELSPRGYTTGTHCPLSRGQAVAAGRHQRKATVLGLPPSLHRAPPVILELSSGARDQTQACQEKPEPLSRSADLAETGAHRRLLTGEVRFRELGFSRCPGFHLQTGTSVCSQ